MFKIRINLFLILISNLNFIPIIGVKTSEDYSYLDIENLFEPKEIKNNQIVDSKFKLTHLHILAESLLNPNMSNESYKSDIVLYLKDGYSPNSQDIFGQTPLHVAASWKRLQFIKEIIEIYENENNYIKLDLNIKDNFQKTVLDYLRNKLRDYKEESLNYQLCKILIFYISKKIKNQDIMFPKNLLT